MNPSENNRDPEFEPWVWKHLAERMRSEADGAGEDSWVDEIDEEELADACASLDALTVDGEAVERPLDETRIAEMVASVVDSDGREDDATILPGPGSTPPAAEEGGKVLEGPSRWSRLRIGAAALLLVAAGVRVVNSSEDDPDAPGTNESMAYHTARMNEPTGSSSDRNDSAQHMLSQVEAVLDVLEGLSLEYSGVSEQIAQEIAGIREVASGSRLHATPGDFVGERLHLTRERLLFREFEASELPGLVAEIAEDCERILTRVHDADFSSVEMVEDDAEEAIRLLNFARDYVLQRIANGE